MTALAVCVVLMEAHYSPDLTTDKLVTKHSPRALSLTKMDKENARNPIIWADVPDISIVRVGHDYYMSSTTMHMSPGLPIMKSRDLVHWKLVSYAYLTLGDNDALTLPVLGSNRPG